MSGAELSSVRDELNLTQRELAEILGVDHKTIWNWENDRVKPHPRHRRRLESLREAFDARRAA